MRQSRIKILGRVPRGQPVGDMLDIGRALDRQNPGLSDAGGDFYKPWPGRVDYPLAERDLAASNSIPGYIPSSLDNAFTGMPAPDPPWAAAVDPPVQEDIITDVPPAPAPGIDENKVILIGATVLALAILLK